MLYLSRYQYLRITPRTAVGHLAKVIFCGPGMPHDSADQVGEKPPGDWGLRGGQHNGARRAR